MTLTPQRPVQSSRFSMWRTTGTCGHHSRHAWSHGMGLAGFHAQSVFTGLPVGGGILVRGRVAASQSCSSMFRLMVSTRRALGSCAPWLCAMAELKLRVHLTSRRVSLLAGVR